jgi:hypothetical protein
MFPKCFPIPIYVAENQYPLAAAQTGEDAKNRILKQTNGFNKTLKKLIKLELTKDLDYESISIGTIELRNRVIHGGYFPTTEETDQAIKDAKLVIQEHNVPIFRD